MNRTRVVVADGLSIFRAGVVRLLERESDFEVVEAASLEQVGAVISERCVDLALVDLDLPPAGGIAAVERVVNACNAQAIVWAFDPPREAVLHAISAGASGFLRKDISPESLLRALRGVTRGQAPLTRDLAKLLIDQIHRLQARHRTLERAAALSPREREVLELVARGARNREIGEALAISEFTVKRHVQNILQKLELPSRRAAAAFHRAAFLPEEVA